MTKESEDGFKDGAHLIAAGCALVFLVPLVIGLIGLLVVVVTIIFHL